MKIPVATRLDPELAQAVRRLAAEGNRSLSREIAEACRRHVALELLAPPDFSPPAAVDGAVSRAASRPATGPDAGQER
jgi:hypothetical protein